MTFLRATCAFALTASLLFACTDDDDPNNGGSSSGSSGSSGSLSCIDPATYDYAVPLRKSGDVAWVVYQSSVDGDVAYLSSIDTVHRLDLTTKTLTDLYRPEGGGAPLHFVRNDDVLVKSSKKLWSLPKAGGAATPLPDFTRSTAGTLAGTSEVRFDGEAIYALESGMAGTIFKHDIATGTETVLGAEPRSERSSIVLGPDAIYSYYRTGDDNGPTTMWKLPKAGGAITNLEVTGAPGAANFPLAAIGNDLYIVSIVPDAFKAYLVKTGKDGGAGTTVGEFDYVLSFKGQIELLPAPGGLVFRFADEVSFLADGATSLTKIFCVSEPWTSNNVFLKDKTLYMHVLDSPNGGVIKLALP